MVGWELLVLTARWRCLPSHSSSYRRYDPAVTLSHALDHLPETVLYYRILNAVN